MPPSARLSGEVKWQVGPARGSASSSWCRAVCPWSWRWLEVKASQSFSCWSWDPCLPRVRVGGRLVRPGRRDHETWLHRALGSIRSHPVSTSPFARSHSFWKNPFTIETVVLQSGLLSESFATWFQEQRDAWKTSSQPLPLAGCPAGMLEPRCPPCLQPSEQTPPHSWLLPGWSPPAAAASPGPALPCPAHPSTGHLVLHRITRVPGRPPCARQAAWVSFPLSWGRVSGRCRTETCRPFHLLVLPLENVFFL